MMIVLMQTDLPEPVAQLKETAVRLQQTLATFGVKVTITDISQGPSVTRYELQPEQGVKVSMQYPFLPRKQDWMETPGILLTPISHAVQPLNSPYSVLRFPPQPYRGSALRFHGNPLQGTS